MKHRLRNSQLVTQGVVEVICQCAQCFRSTEIPLTKAYSHSDPVLNVRYLSDCLSALRSVLSKGYASPLQRPKYNTCLEGFTKLSLERIREVAELLLREIQAGPYRFAWVVANEHLVSCSCATKCNRR